MAIPKVKFLGLSSADPDRYDLPRNVGIKLNDKDVGRARELLKYRWRGAIGRLAGCRPQGTRQSEPAPQPPLLEIDLPPVPEPAR